MVIRLFTRTKILTNANRIKFYSMHFKEQQVTVGGQCINYLKTGNGNHTVLCFPGALGTIWSDFKPQIENLNKNKFTVIALDPPGYGHSRPPHRSFSSDFYEKDADIAFEFMKALGINKYSLLGWSDGGITSIILAAKYPATVLKLVIWGANAYVAREDIEAYERVSNIKNWSEKMRTPLIALYGEELLQKMWTDWYNILKNIYEKCDGNICKDKLSLIQCPTLILHGNKDPMVPAEHPEYLLNNIRGAKLHTFPDGKHNIHLRYSKEFNEIVTKFLEENYKAKL